MKLPKRFIRLTTLLCLWSLHAIAISHQDFTFQLSPASKELSQQTVRDIFEDSSGFVWFLTQEGLNRFDGYEVIRFRASNAKPGGLSHQSITSMIEDSEGNFWITTAGGGLNKLTKKDFTFETYTYSGTVTDRSPISNVIMSAMISKDGTIWLGYGQGGGFSKLDPRTETFKHYPDSDPQSLGIVRDFAETENGRIWAAIEDKGLYEIDPQNPEKPRKLKIISKVRPGLEVMKLTKLMTDDSGHLWLTSLSDGVIGINPLTNEIRYLSHELNSSSAGALESYMAIEDDEGNLWIGTTAGIQIVSSDKTRITTIDTNNSSLPDDQVFSLLISPSGVTWVGTYNGLAYGTRSLFERYSEQDGLSSGSTNAFAQTKDGTIWIANDGGIDMITSGSPENKLDAITISKAPFDLPSNRVMSLLADGNILWAGTLNAGLFKIDLANQALKHYYRDPERSSSLNANGITSLIKIDDKTLLVGTYGGGLNELDLKSDTFSSHMTDSSKNSTISNNMVVALLQDSYGEVWVGTEQGINRYDPFSKTFTRFNSDIENPNSLSSDMAWSIEEDVDGDLWIGTQSGGIHRWPEGLRRNGLGEFENYSDEVGIPSADIYSITSSGEKLWLSHNRGITTINIKDLTTSNFDVTDGLQGPEFNHGAAFQDKEGYLYFGGPNGFNRIHSTHAEKNNLNPPIRLTSVKILNKDTFFDSSYEELSEISLEYNFDFITFTFASLDYKNPALNNYRYKLNGLNDEWIDLGTTRQISFTRLPPGVYELAVQGTNSDGVWSEKGRSLSLIVNPPFWLTSWAYTVYAILVSLAIAYALLMQRRRALKEETRRRELEEKVRERTVDLQRARVTAENATRAKSEFLAAMSHEIRTPMHGMLGMTDLLMQTKLSEQQMQFAQSARASGESLLALVNAILDFSKIEAKKVEIESIEFDLRKLLEDVCYLLRESASKKAIDFNLCVSPSIRHLYFGDPNKIRQIATNLIGNAIKFTDAGRVRVDVSDLTPQNDDDANIEISVIDTGIGIDSQTQEKIFESFTQADASTTRQYGGTGLGLTISKELVDLMGGKIQITSEVGAGAKFTVKIPLRRSVKLSMPSVTNVDSVGIFVSSSDLRDSLEAALSYYSVQFTNKNDLKSLVLESEAHSVFLIEYDAIAARLYELNGSSVTSPIIFIADTATIEVPSTIRNWAHVLRPITTDSLLSAFKQLFVVRSSQKPPGLKLHSSATPNLTRRLLDVLVVEDVEVNQRIAGAMLEILGSRVTIANNGREALDYLEVSDYDIIFMDCQMPVMDGLQATRKIRESFAEIPKKRNVPIVALTAGGDKSERERALDAGMDFYITKPFTLDDMRMILTKVFNDFSRDENTREEDAPYPSKLFPENKDNSELLDAEIMKGIIEIEQKSGADLLNKLVSGFNTQAREKIREMGSAIMDADRDEIRKCAHAIKSMSANIGATQIRGVFDSIERRHSDIPLEEIEREITQFDEKLELFNEALVSWRKTV